MPGLLDYVTAPRCPNDPEHGSMEEQPGSWAVDQVEMTAVTGWVRTGRFYSARLFRCSRCGLLQLYDRF